MWRFTLKQAVAHRSRLALTLLAVVLGITFVTGSLVLTDTSQKLFDEQFRTAAAGVDVTVRDAVAFDSAMGVEVERDPIPPGIVKAVSEVAGVGEARAVVTGQGLLEVDGEAIVPQGPSVLSSWVVEPFGAFTIRTGRSPVSVDEVVVDVATAEEHGIAVGDTVTVRSATSLALEVVGLAGFGESDGLPNTTVALVSTPAAQQLLDLGTAVSEVRVVADRGVSRTTLRDDLSTALGASYDISSSRDTAAASAAAAKTSLGYLRLMLFAMAGAALLVGAFLIANTFSIVVGQRSRELAVLRAVGATGRQVVASVWGEALLLGVLGSAIGVGLGVLAASGLREVVGAFGIALPDDGMTVLPRTVLTAFLVGVLVTVAAAAAPSRRAAQVAPVEAMRESTSGRGIGGRRFAIGVAVAILAVSSLGLVVLAGAPAVLVGLGAGGVLLALGLLGPALAPALVRLVGRPLELLGVPGRLARQSAVRAPRRTAATVMALAVSLGLVSFMAIVATSVNGSISTSYEETISADYVVESARGEMLGGLAPRAYERVRQLDEVAVVSRLRYGHWKDGDATRALTAIDPATLPLVTNVDLAEGSFADLADGGVVLAEAVAAEQGLEVGDRLPMTFSRTGRQSLEVVGLMVDADAQALNTSYFIGLSTFAKQFSENVDASVFVKLADGVSPAAAGEVLERALADFPTADVRDQAAAVEGRTGAIDQILGLVTVLLLFTVLIALMGITNTLALSIVERVREIGLLRAVGMTRGQLRRMVHGEAALTAAAAVVVGLGLGAAFAASVVAALGRNAPVALELPLGRLVLVLLVATVAGLAAGLLPARRAARLDVLAAIGTE